MGSGLRGKDGDHGAGREDRGQRGADHVAGTGAPGRPEQRQARQINLAHGNVFALTSALEHHGIEALGPVLILAGVLQMVAGQLKVGQWFRAMSPAVIHGMLAGIGVLIGRYLAIKRRGGDMKLANLTSRSHRVMTIKHGAHTFNIDPATTDTYRHYHEGQAERVANAEEARLVANEAASEVAHLPAIVDRSRDRERRVQDGHPHGPG